MLFCLLPYLPEGLMSIAEVTFLGQMRNTLVSLSLPNNSFHPAVCMILVSRSDLIEIAGDDRVPTKKAGKPGIVREFSKPGKVREHEIWSWIF